MEYKRRKRESHEWQVQQKKLMDWSKIMLNLKSSLNKISGNLGHYEKKNNLRIIKWKKILRSKSQKIYLTKITEEIFPNTKKEIPIKI